MARNQISLGDQIIEARMEALRSERPFYMHNGSPLRTKKEILDLPRPRTATLPWPPSN